MAYTGGGDPIDYNRVAMLKAQARITELEAEVERLRKPVPSFGLVREHELLKTRIDRALESLNRYAANGLDIWNSKIPELIAILEGTNK